LIGELVTLYGNNNTDLTNYTLIGELINATKTEPINYTLIENLIKQYQNNLTSEDVWTYSDRQLTAFNFTVNTTINLNNINSTDIAQAIWNYGGPVNSNIIQQFGDYTVCMIESILNPDEGWGVQIRQC
jgi:hypothetical protein